MQKRKVTGEMCLDLEPARDGVLKNAGPDLIRVAARYRVNPNDLERATAELQNTAGELKSPTLPRHVSDGKMANHGIIFYSQYI
jgi:hypothetical protein